MRSPSPTNRLVRLSAGRESYCLDIGSLSGIHRSERLRLNPKQEHPLGWLPVPEGEIPVFSLAERLGGTAATEGTIVALRGPLGPWGLLVDRVTRVVTAFDRVYPLPRIVDSRAGLFRGVVALGEEMLLYLDPERLHPEGASVPASEAPAGRGLGPPADPLPGGRPPQRPVRRTGRLLVFSLLNPAVGAWNPTCGLSITQVLEIMPSVQPVRVPQAPPHVWGLANWRGCPVPVVDVGLRLGLPPARYDAAARLLVSRTASGSGLVAIPAQQEMRGQSLPVRARRWEGELLPESSFTCGIFHLDSGPLVIPDLDAIVRAA